MSSSEAAQELFETDHVHLNHGQVTRTIPDSPNNHTKILGEFSTSTDLTYVISCTRYRYSTPTPVSGWIGERTRYLLWRECVVAVNWKCCVKSPMGLKEGQSEG
ncbi:hypothetical protein TNCV_4622861 [Trichonephila clavipes]|nr:hypothetical protein TNCV_4622861 [Trichonephila clavipes]